MTTLISAKQVREQLHYRSRSGFYELLSRDPDLQACVVKIGRKLLFDEKRVDRYIERHRLIVRPISAEG